MTDLPRHRLAAEADNREGDKIWPLALLWFAGLVPFFFLSYGLANVLADANPNVGSIAYGWEHHIPFMPWTIVPYWSIDLFYGAALFLCGSQADVDTLGKRLLSVQVIAVLCFILLPLSFSFTRPEISGLPAQLFALLEGFDKPYNQAPSLHIALLVVLWVHYAALVPDRFRKTLHVWFAAIGVSVLTTYQHHFIDVPTGAMLGLFCVWLWSPSGKPAYSDFKLTSDWRRLKLAAVYGLAGGVLMASALAFGGTALWLGWPSASLILVAMAYACLGEEVFQKDQQGRIKLVTKLLLAPYLIGAWANSRCWTYTRPQPVHVAGDIWIGRFPSRYSLQDNEFAAVVDMTAELPAPRHQVDWTTIPNLDLVVPGAKALYEAAAAIENARHSGKTLLCCALGFSRSSHAAATWLARSGYCSNVDDAIALVHKAQPHFNPDPDSVTAIGKAALMVD